MANVIEGSGEPQVLEDFKLPSAEDLVAAIESMGLGEEEKKELLEGLARQQAGQGFPGLGAAPPPLDVAANSGNFAVLWVLILFSLVFLVLVFFGYKLYKSLVDRERRKEEKKRQKLQKKKK